MPKRKYEQTSVLDRLVDPTVNLAVVPLLSATERQLISMEYKYISRAQKMSLRDDVQTKCTTTAAVIRKLLTPLDNCGDRWHVSVSNDEDRSDRVLEQTEHDVCQVDYNNDNHWITYHAPTGNVYHSWYGKFAIRCERDIVEPGPMTLARALFIYNELVARLNDKSNARGKIDLLDATSPITIYEPNANQLSLDDLHRRVDILLSADLECDQAPWKLLDCNAR